VVAGRTLDGAVLGMHVDLEDPPDRWDGDVEAGVTVAGQHLRRLQLEPRHPTAAERLDDAQLPLRLARRAVVSSGEDGQELPRPWPSRRVEALALPVKGGHGAHPGSDDMLDGRCLLGRRDVAGQIDRRARRAGDAHAVRTFDDLVIVDERGAVCLYSRLPAWLALRGRDHVDEAISRASANPPRATGGRPRDDKVRPRRAERDAPHQFVRFGAGEAVGARDDPFEEAVLDELPTSSLADAVGIEHLVGDGGVVTTHPFDDVAIETSHVHSH